MRQISVDEVFEAVTKVVGPELPAISRLGGSI